MATLLDLPYELHCEITNQLPLGARLIYQTQICHHLRNLFYGSFTLPQPSSFRLVEWRRASSEVAKLLQRDEEQIISAKHEKQALNVANDGHMQVPMPKKSIWETSPSSTPKPAPAKLRGPFQTNDEVSALANMTGLTTGKYVSELPISSTSHPSGKVSAYILDSIPHGDHSDVDLFARCLKLLGRLNNRACRQMSGQDDPNQRFSPPTHQITPLLTSPIRVLSLLSRTGFKVASLIYLLQNVPALHSVETVLMTSAGNAELILWSIFQPSRQAFQWPHAVSPIIGLHDDVVQMPFEVSMCCETQAIVVPGPLAQRGQGLRSGFKCLCFHHSHQDTSDTASEISQQFSTKKAFHVIFHDWYDEAEAEGTQDMLHHSDITCNSCKQTILF